jgi:hypothetical protein
MRNFTFIIATVIAALGVMSSPVFAERPAKYDELEKWVIEFMKEKKETYEKNNPGEIFAWKFVEFKNFPDCQGMTVGSSNDVLRGLYFPIGGGGGGDVSKGIKVVNKDTHEDDGKIIVQIGIASWAQKSGMANNATKHYRLYEYYYAKGDDGDMVWFYEGTDKVNRKVVLHVTCRQIKAKIIGDIEGWKESCSCDDVSAKAKSIWDIIRGK